MNKKSVLKHKNRVSFRPRYSAKAKSYRWLKWASDLQAIAQNGLTYTKDVFDRERYLALRNIVVDMITCQSHHQPQAISQLFETESGYATPKVDVRGAVFQDHKILLVQERSDKRWTLPGGWCDINLSPAENVIKEIQEESGFITKAVKLVALFDKFKHDHPRQLPHTYKCFFLCEAIGGQAMTSIETMGVEFFALDELPELSLPRVTAEQIARCYAHWQDLSLPTDFD